MPGKRSDVILHPGVPMDDNKSMTIVMVVLILSLASCTGAVLVADKAYQQCSPPNGPAEGR